MTPIGPPECDVCGGAGEQVCTPGPSVDPYEEQVRKECGPCEGSGVDLEECSTGPMDWAISAVRYLGPDGEPVAIEKAVGLIVEETPLGESDAELAIERAVGDGFLADQGSVGGGRAPVKTYVSTPVEGA